MNTNQRQVVEEVLPDLLFLLALSSEQHTQSWEQTAIAHGWAECSVAS